METQYAVNYSEGRTDRTMEIQIFPLLEAARAFISENRIQGYILRLEAGKSPFEPISRVSFVEYFGGMNERTISASEYVNMRRICAD